MNPEDEFVLGNILDRILFSKLLKENEIVYHLASAVGVGQSQYQIDHYVEANTQGTARMLDILVNDIWGGDELSEWGKPFWELDWQKGRLMLERAVHTHIITSRHGVPLMIPHNQGLIIEITDGDNYQYRGNLLYDLAKISTIRLAEAMAADLHAYQITALALTPGFLRSEAMLDHFGVTA